MANWATLKSAIAAVIKANGNKEITGAILQQTLFSMVSNLGANYQFYGSVTPSSTAPTGMDNKIFVFAVGNGVYPNFGGLRVSGKSALFYNDDSNNWVKVELDSMTYQNAILTILSLNIATGDNAFYINSSGTQVNDPNYHSSDLFTVVAGSQIMFLGGGHGSVMALSFYDSNSTFISGTNFGISTTQTLFDITTVPTNAVYCRASYKISDPISVVTTTALKEIKEIAKTTANSVSTLKNSSGVDGVSIYRNVGSRAIWNTANKYATITLTDTITSLSLLRIMTYSYEKNFVSDIVLGLYITPSGISKIIAENNATSHIAAIKYIAATKKILITFADTNSHRVVSVNECISSNSSGNIQNATVEFSANIPAETWVDVNNVSPFGNLEASIISLQNQITVLQTGTFVETTDYWTQATTNGYIGTTGADVGSDTNWRRSGFIPCTPGQKLKVRLYGYTAINCISLYNSSNTYITGYKASSNGVLYENEITIPSGVAYFRISGGYDGWASSAATLPHYANLSSEKSIWDIISDLETQVDEAKSGTFTRLIDYWTQATITAYITKTGTLSSSDQNWRSTDFIQCTPGEILDVRLTGHTAVNNVSFYTGAYVFISGVGITSGSLYTNNVTVPENATYMRISGGSDTYGAADLPHYCKLNQSVEFFTEIDRINAKLGNQLNIPLLSPWAIYTVCNNTIVSAKGRNRNYSQAVYIDHFFNGFTSEKDIRVKDGVDKIVFNAPMVVTDANETSPAVTYNGGVNVLEETKTFTLRGKDIVDTNLSVKHRSVLNSVTANAHPKILCIGDSITYAEQANIPDDGYTQNYAYHLICKELFMKDAIDNGNTGHNITFLGIYEKTKTFTYGGQNYNVKTHHEGIRGISLTKHLTGQVAQFKDDATGNWSLQAWLNKYRTLDDNGNRLTVGSGTGSLITSGNINSIDVCTPTHVVIMLGANGGGTLAQWQQMVGIIKTEFPNMIVGISIPDAAGTYFPSLHPNCNPLCTIWNDTGAQGSRHNQQYGLQSMLQTYWGDPTREAANEYILPFYYVAPTAESVALRDVHLPDSDIKLMAANKYYDNYGWHASTHVNGIGQTNWGYSLYSWIKYTIAKSL